jgi:hypothetical protein
MSKILLFGPWKIVIMGLLLPICLGGIYGTISIISYLRKPVYAELTSPLERSVVQDVCMQLSIPTTQSPCQEGQRVYAPDFFGLIHSTFKVGINTYDDVEEKIGKYRFDCETPVTYRTRTGFDTNYRCWYDLNGDRVYKFGFRFTLNGVITQSFFNGWETPF